MTASKRIEFATGDGVLLRGDFFRAENANAPIVVMLGGLWSRTVIPRALRRARDDGLADHENQDHLTGPQWRSVSWRGDQDGFPSTTAPFKREARSASDEGKQIGVDHVSMGERHAVRIALVDLQRGILHQFG
jgi:hypothetical protein